MRRVLSLAIGLAILIVTPARAAETSAPFDSAAALAKARELHTAVRISDASQLWSEFNDAMRSAMGDRDKFETVLKGIAQRTGPLTSCVRETMESHDRLWTYRAYCLFEKAPVPLVLEISFDGAGKIAGLWIKPPQKAYPTTRLDYQAKTRLHLPFYGEWYVLWGGRDLEHNYHAVTRDQRFAYDFVVLRDSSTHRGSGRSLADYYCYGAAIVAPAKGKVVAAWDGLRENRPGQMDHEHPFGNYVVLAQDSTEYSVLAHFQTGSVRVKAGQEVAEGDTLGQCGNSGNSSEPHLHFHLQNGPNLFEADGLPAPFVDYVSNGKAIDKSEPLKGERIRRK